MFKYECVINDAMNFQQEQDIHSSAINSTKGSPFGVSTLQLVGSQLINATSV